MKKKLKFLYMPFILMLTLTQIPVAASEEPECSKAVCCAKTTATSISAFDCSFMDASCTKKGLDSTCLTAGYSQSSCDCSDCGMISGNGGCVPSN